jgi:hypothetical protein
MPNNTVIATVGGTKSKTKVVGSRTISGKKYSVEKLPKKVKGGYIGLNKKAAKELGIKTNLKYNEVAYYPCRKKSTNKRTIQHELIEQHCMRYGQMPYKEAHKVALRFENTKTKPSDALKWWKNQK